ncbi:MAG: hypothetical protein O7B26_03695, partial [Planctomycetota bacterium]|nr:hypothetical protein [Planctomycetota bacterium]
GEVEDSNYAALLDEEQAVRIARGCNSENRTVQTECHTNGTEGGRGGDCGIQPSKRSGGYG